MKFGKLNAFSKCSVYSEYLHLLFLLAAE